MRISDWSSDVCSSDLCDDDLLVRHRRHVTRREDTGLARRAARVDLDLAAIAQCHRIAEPFGVWDQADLDENPFEFDEMFLVRSEEHTSELQSLMRISYAVFCLKKKIY